MQNLWTDEEIDVIKNNYQTLTDKQISGLLQNRSPSSVKSKRQELGFEKDKVHRKYSFDDVIKEFDKTDYILLSSPNEYINAAENTLRYLCPKHLDKGEMSISLGHLLDGRGCYYCGRERTDEKRKLPDDIMNKQCETLCSSKGFIYNGFQRKDGKIYILYECSHHLEAGIQCMSKGNMNRENIIGCPYCVDTKKYFFSKGEKKIREFLDTNNLVYIQQFIFDDCIDIRPLPFDFYLPMNRICIEYDGQHHFYPVTFNGISMEEAMINHQTTVKHDGIKNQYCIDNNYDLLRIPYYDYRNIDQILSNYFKERKIA